jgi:uncharacterized protein
MDAIWNTEPDLEKLRHSYGMLKTNPSEALHDLRDLADRGSVMSMIYIANAYRNGVGTNTDLRQAEEWYRRAADGGSILASYELGRVFLERKEYHSAKEAFDIGVSQNYPPSMHMLALMYLRGTGVVRDISKARDLLERAAALGHIFSKRNIGVLLMKGHFGLSQVPKGVLLLLSALKDALIVVSTDPTSDRLR